MPDAPLALIVPTMDRPQPLRRLLASIAAQSAQPAQILVVDGGRESAVAVLAEYPQLPLRHLQVRPPSLTRQKNAGLGALAPEVTLVGFLDDDVVLEPECLAAMQAFWETAQPQVGGAGFLDVLAPPRRGVWLKRLFALDSERDGWVLPSGHNTSLRAQPRPYEVRWLPGGASLWRREAVEAFRFDEWFTGYSYLEDVEYSLRVGRRYRLMAVPQSRIRHESARFSWRQQFRFGVWQVTNRIYLVRRHPELSLGWCLWSLVGQLVLNATVGLGTWGVRALGRTCGNVVGWASLAAMRPGSASTAGGAP